MLIALALAQLLAATLLVRPGATPSRRWLAGALGLLVPVAGPFLGWLARRARGRGSPLRLEEAFASMRPPAAAELRRLGELPPLLDRLMSADAGERLAALVELSRASGLEGVRLLRWALEHGPAEVALDAALCLEELGLRQEARLDAATRALEAEPTFERAIAVADVAGAAVTSGLADAAAASVLAERAREAYAIALHLEPARLGELAEPLAALERASGLRGVRL